MNQRTKKFMKNLKLKQKQIQTLSRESSDTENSNLQCTYSWEEEDQFKQLQEDRKVYAQCRDLDTQLRELEQIILNFN